MTSAPLFLDPLVPVRKRKNPHAPLVFEDRRDGRVDAMLGAVEIGSIVPIDSEINRAAYTFALPPGRGFRFVRDTDAAKRSLAVLTRQWLKAAGVKGA